MPDDVNTRGDCYSATVIVPAPLSEGQEPAGRFHSPSTGSQENDTRVQSMGVCDGVALLTAMNIVLPGEGQNMTIA